MILGDRCGEQLDTMSATLQTILTRLRALAVVLVVPLSGCTYVSADPHVMITSTPAGADVLVDGEATGATTPTKLALGGGDHEITLRKRGFSDESRTVYHYTTFYTSRWIDVAAEVSLYALPLWWTFGDWFTPFAVRFRYVPHEIHVRLYSEGKGPVRSDATPEP